MRRQISYHSKLNQVVPGEGRMLKRILLLGAVTWSFQTLAAGVSIDVNLSPAGNFKAQTEKVTGSAYRSGDAVIAENVAIDLRALSTGIALRDKHTKERLMVSEFPQAKLIKAEGKDGKGQATIEVKGKRLEVSGTYKIEGNNLKAEFPVQLSELDIKDVRYMGVGVKDKVVVRVDLPLKGAPERSAASAPPRGKK
ncbi:MAG: YceI family protein [Calothrix sp. SM1_5_4]|nr:YceI family protein [Calothrix sp. SM1_5_4]